MPHSLFITCPRGLEPILAQEIAQQNCAQIVPTDGGVSARGGLEHVYRINLYSRTASRVLLQLAQAPYRSEDDLYRAAKSIAWENWFGVEKTFKIKDGLCDRFRSQTGSRPSVDKARPDVRIHLFLDDKTASIFIDTSGEALFKRGYRQDTGEAPLRENLAAGLLLLAGYNGTQPMQDPFCGSGTIAIEAAWIAQNRAAGLMRRFGFEQFNNFDKPLWTKLKAAARAAIRQPENTIAASDNDRRMISAAQANAAAAEVENIIQFNVLDAQDTRPNGANGILVANPPYGVRLAEIQALHALYPQLGSWLKQHYAGWTAGLLSGDMEMPKLMRLKPKRKIPLFNGNLDCRLFLFDMVAGSNRKE